MRVPASPALRTRAGRASKERAGFERLRAFFPYLGWGLLTAWGLVGMDAVGKTGGMPGSPLAGLLSGLAGAACLVAAAVLSLCRRRGASRADGPARQRPQADGPASQLPQAGGPASQLPQAPRADALLARREAAVGGAVMACCCVAALAARTDFPAAWFQAAMQAVASASYIVLIMGWVRAYSRLDPQDMEELSVASTAACALVYLAAIVSPAIVASLIWAALPVGSALCLRACLDREPDGAGVSGEAGPGGAPACASSSGEPSGPSETPAAESVAPSGPGPIVIAGPSPRDGAARPVTRPRRRQLLFCFLGVLVGSAAIVVPPALVPLAGGGTAGLAPLARLSGLALSAALVLYCTVYARRIDLAQFFRILYPLAVCGLCLLCAPGGGAPQLVGLALLCAAQWVLYLFVWLYALERSVQAASPAASAACGKAAASGDAPLAYALLRLAFEAGFLASNALSLALASAGPPDALQSAGLCFASAAAFALTILLPLDEAPEERDAAAGQPAEPTDGADKDSRAGSGAGAGSPVSADLAELFGLSPREAQILSYLRRGYSLVAIRNELYISKGTVDTYAQASTASSASTRPRSWWTRARGPSGAVWSEAGRTAGRDSPGEQPPRPERPG